MPEPSPRVLCWSRPLAKNDRDDQAIEAATELGADEVIPWQADWEHRAVSAENAGEKARRKWDPSPPSSLPPKQSRRSRRPSWVRR